MKQKTSLAEKFLWLAVTAIAAAGLYSLVPVIGRTPQFKDLPVAQRLFDVALVVHVDLSVLVWSLAMLSMGLALVFERRQEKQRGGAVGVLAIQAGFYAVAAATVMIALSPLGEWVAVKSNYIPVLHNVIFLLGLALLMAGMVVIVLPLVEYCGRASRWAQLTLDEYGWISAGLVALLGLAAYGASGYLLPPIADLHNRYETLFWAGGHVMQFAYTLTAMVAWLMLLAATGRFLPNARLVLLAYLLPVIGAAASVAGFVWYSFGDDAFRQFQTERMIELAGLGPSLLAVGILWKLLQKKPAMPMPEQALETPLNQIIAEGQAASSGGAYGNALVVSLLLFFAGGALGLLISGQNVTIPAHYHGMIVGITQGLMGLAYVMLPRFGYASVAQTRLARWQPIVYGLGQFMHIGGLAYCGGYGILRKTAGGFQNLAPDIKIALGIFGFGGLLAITGGILFVVVMIRAWVRRDLSRVNV